MLRTAKQYVESLNDGRIIYLNGERIPDITKNQEVTRVQVCSIIIPGVVS